MRYADTVTVSVCSHSPRIHLFSKGFLSIIGQVDHMNVYLNDISEIPEFLRHPKVRVLLGKDARGDLGSNAKFYFASSVQGYHFIIDDDIIFPPDFVSRMVEAVELYERRAVICVHGSIFPERFVHYHRSKRTIHFRKGLRENRQVHAAGSGTVAYHSDALRLSLDVFEQRNMDDIYFAIYCKFHDIPIIAICRRYHWLRSSGPKNDAHTIYTQRKRCCAEETRLIIQAAPWPRLSSQGG